MEKKRVLKLGDILLVAIVVVAVSFTFTRFVFSNTTVNQVKVTAKSYQEYFQLDEDRTIYVEGPLGITTLIIKDEEVWVEDSPCREKICIKMGKISRAKEQLVCVPNRVVVELGGEKGNVDGISR